MDRSKEPHDPGLSSAFERSRPANSVLTRIEQRTGQAPRVSLREEAGSAGAPLIDPRSQEKRSLPQGRGAYQLLGEIARGGMGVILKGHDTDLGRDVALKVLNQDLADRPEAVRRFVEEAQIGGQLQHPGIVPVYELGLMADERPYFTMKLVKGQTLANLLADRKSPAQDRARLLDVFEAICQTMGYAHSRGVIHRDLKPANVMVGAFGEVQVVDWGLAKVLARGGTADERRAQGARTTQTVLETVRSPGSKPGSGSDSIVGSVMGTPAYMPPEQASGHVDRLDERSDVFSLGAILCEILTGSPPYTGASDHPLVEAAQASLDAALARLDACGADPELVQLTRQCLLPAPAARPRNAGVLAERIHDHVASLEQRAEAARIEAAEARVHAQEERRARKLTLALAAAVLGLGVLGGGGWLWVQNERAVREHETVERERDLVARVSAALNEASAFQGQGLWSNALAAVDRAEALAEAGPASAELSASVGEARERVSAASEAANARAERARAAAAFVAELEEIGRGSDGREELFDWARIEADYARVFRSRGIDVDGSSPEEVGAALAELGVGTELAPVLDLWLVVRRNLSRDRAQSTRAPEDLSACLRLVEITYQLDDDPLRADLREALINDELEVVTQLAETDLGEQPTSTVVLLGTALRLVDRRDEALRVLHEAAARHPGEYGLMTALLDTLRTNVWSESWDPEESLEACRLARAALAVRPENRGLRRVLFWQLMALAQRAELRGEVDASRARYRQAVDEKEAQIYGYARRPWREDAPVPGVPPQEYVELGFALDSVGEHERALAAFRLFAAPELADFEVHGRPSRINMAPRGRRAGIPLLRSGDLEAAERCFAFVFDFYPEDSETYHDLAFTRVLVQVRDGAPDDVRAALRQAVEESAVAGDWTRNDLAWRCVRWPREVLRAACAPASPADVERVERNLEALTDEALRLSEAATRGIDSGTRWNTLAVARYRTGDDEGCLRALERSMAVEGGNASDRYFLAMAHHRLGSEEEALLWHERALEATGRAWSGSREDAEEMLWFRAEAAALLGADQDGR